MFIQSYLSFDSHSTQNKCQHFSLFLLQRITKNCLMFSFVFFPLTLSTSRRIIDIRKLVVNFISTCVTSSWHIRNDQTLVAMPCRETLQIRLKMRFNFLRQIRKSCKSHASKNNLVLLNMFNCQLSSTKIEFFRTFFLTIHHETAVELTL